MTPDQYVQGMQQLITLDERQLFDEYLKRRAALKSFEGDYSADGIAALGAYNLVREVMSQKFMIHIAVNFA